MRGAIVTVQTTSGTGQAPTAETPGQGQDPAGQPDQQQAQQQGQTGQAPGDPQPFDPSTIQDPAVRAWVERQEAELRRARQEAAQFRTERGTLQEQVQQFQRAQETDAERVQREAQERQQRIQTLEQEVRTLRVGTALTTAATTAGAHNPARVAALLDRDVETDAEGKPTNVDAILRALQRSDPYLFRTQPAGADAGRGNRREAAPTGAPDINAAIRGARTNRVSR
jgi:hypothetical protein